jgi:hypothetical protein
MSIASCTRGRNKHYNLENKNMTKQLAEFIAQTVIILQASLAFPLDPARFPFFLAETIRDNKLPNCTQKAK